MSGAKCRDAVCFLPNESFLCGASNHWGVRIFVTNGAKVLFIFAYMIHVDAGLIRMHVLLMFVS